MIRRACMILGLCMMLGGCSALPAEERSFAVALGVSAKDGLWEVSARIPSYQSDGGYMTLEAEGNSLQEALGMLDASAPMRMHYGQVRLIVFGYELAQTDAFCQAVEELSCRADIRLQAQVCVTQDDVKLLMDALNAQTGMRLSKSLDVMLETRQKLGVIPDTSLSSMMRMGERQHAVLMTAHLDETGIVRLEAGCLTDSESRAAAMLTPEEMQLLSLMQGRMKKAVLMLGGHGVMLTDVSSSVMLEGSAVQCCLELKTAASEWKTEDIRRDVQNTAAALVQKLSAARCDALGLGRQAVRQALDMQAWHTMNWPGVYPQLVWDITVEVQPPA